MWTRSFTAVRSHLPLSRLLGFTLILLEPSADGTGVEGEYSAVMKVIEECHEAVHAMGCVRLKPGLFRTLEGPDRPAFVFAGVNERAASRCYRCASFFTFAYTLPTARTGTSRSK